jgi:hypothetical protein
MPANKNNLYLQDSESSPLMGQETEPCDVIFRRFREQYKFHLAGAWLLVILATAGITYIANHEKMNNIDPNKCTSDRTKNYALILSTLFGVVGMCIFFN